MGEGRTEHNGEQSHGDLLGLAPGLSGRQFLRREDHGWIGKDVVGQYLKR